MLRIHIEAAYGAYSIPADNPFAGQPKARPKIWAYGFAIRFATASIVRQGPC